MRLCQIWGRETLVTTGGMRLWNYGAENGGVRERRKRASWGIWRRQKRWDKRAAAGWSSVRYFSCLPILLVPFYFFPLCGGVRRKSANQAKGNAKARKNLKSPRGDNPGPFAGSGGWGYAPHFWTWRSPPEAGGRDDGLGGWGTRIHFLREFLYNTSCIQLDAVRELYYPAFRGGIGDRVWVGTVIGINCGEGLDLPLGCRPPHCLSLPDRGCEVVGPEN